MGTILSAVLGLCLWLALWAINTKALDAFIITILIVLVALSLRMLLPFVPGNRRQ